MNQPPRTWTFTALELTVLWHAIGRDVLPYPLHYRSSENTAADYENAYKNAATRLRNVFDEDLYGPLRVLVEPEARIEIAGYAGTSEPVPPRHVADPTSRIRVHAAISGRNAAILTQKPTTNADGGADVQLTYTAANTVTRRILGALPDTPRGSHPEIRIDRDSLEKDDDGPFTGFFDDTPQPGRREIHQFFERPRSSVVHLAVYPGGAYDHRPAPARDFHLIDYPDGRYRVRATATVHAVGASTAELATHLQGLLERTLSDQREDNEP